ncbi:unnamed protein product [Dovyalis caffra]|uniref:Major facilitator superfamily (MFS) profile domain-containing protein n=1 Tax=Dovyalis caffra TaxID=77055 RepID=A0AAV1S5V3_9ROSI|nr:unnamed protein product [Dovyalis caffra]
MDGEIPVYTLDEALASVGFGKFQVLLLAYAGLGWFSEAMELMILSFVGPVVKSQWDLSPGQESLLSTVVFAGMLVGAFSWGLVSDCYGRRQAIFSFSSIIICFALVAISSVPFTVMKGLLGLTLLTSGAGLLSAFSPNYASLLILRFLVGAGVGGTTVFCSWFLEFVPVSHRGKRMVLLSMLWTFGTLFEVALAWSPRYLCMKGRINDACNILEKIARMNQSKLPPGMLVPDSTIGLDEEYAASECTPLLSTTRKMDLDFRSGFSSFVMLFSPKLIRTTLLLWGVYFGNIFSYYGILLLASELSREQSQCGSSTVFRSENLQDDSLYINVFITSLAELPGVILSAILVDSIGRKLSTAFMFVSAFVFLLPLVYHQSSTLTTALLFGARMSTKVSSTLGEIYAQEVSPGMLYPTTVRATGAGVSSAVGRVGGMICPLVAVGLVTGCHIAEAVILCDVVMAISAVCVLLIPSETKGQKLSDSIDHELDSKQVVAYAVMPMNEPAPEESSIRMDGESSVYTLDEALASVGFGKFQVLVLLYTGLGWFAEAMELMILSFVGPVVKSQWDLSSSQESILTTVVFAGMLVGTFSWGLVSDHYGRRQAILSLKGLLGITLLTSGAGLLSPFSPNYASLVIFRCLVGFGVGGTTVFNSWFLEFVPVAHRGTRMVLISMFWTFGTIFEAALAWIVMPRLGWRWLLALSSLPSIAMVLFYSLVPESPRYLCMKGRIADAHNILEKIARLNQSKLPPGMLVSDSKLELDEEFAASEDTPLLYSTRKMDLDFRSGFSSFFTIFSSKLIRTTLLLWELYFGNVFSYYGIMLLASELSRGQSKCGSSTALQSENLQDDSLYVNVFITSLAEIPGLLLSAIMVDRIGRKLSISFLFVLACISLLPLVYHQSETLTTALLFGARMSSRGAFAISSIYAPELYPTAVRATGAGVASSVGRVGGMICPLVAVGLVTGCKLTEVIILFEVVMAISAVCVLLIPFETKGQVLSDCVNVSDSEQVVARDGESSVYTLDEALASVGFGKFQVLVLLYTGLGSLAEAMELMILSFVGPVVKSQWDLSSSQESILTTVVFAGMLVGTFSWGLVSDHYGRRQAILKGLLGITLLTSGAGLLSPFSPNYASLVIFRCLVGFGVGGTTVFGSLFLEFVPVARRGTRMVLLSMFWTFGTIFEAALAWIVMPRLSWRWLLALSSLPSIALLLVYSLVPESPRYLCMKGRIADAHNILEKIARLNQSKLPPGMLVSDSTLELDEEFAASEDTPLLYSTRKMDSDFRSGFSSLATLFSSKLIRTTLLLWELYFGNVFSYYGIILLASELGRGQRKCGSITALQSENLQDDSVYVNVFITSLAEIPGLLLSAIMVDRIGRKLSISFLFVLACISLLPLVYHQSETLTTALLFGARMSSRGAFAVSSIYAPELYPTAVRATGAGVASAVGRVGGMICPLVAVGLVTGCKLTEVIILFEVVMAISAVCVLLIPSETKGQDLSDCVNVSDSE